MTQQTSLKELLTLRVPPIGIGFFSEPPAGVEHYGTGRRRRDARCRRRFNERTGTPWDGKT